MLATTADELDALFRAEVDDVIPSDAVDPVDGDRLWKEAEVYSYMTEAADEVARRTSRLYKTVQIPVVAGTQFYRLPPYVLEVRNARLVVNGRTLRQHNINEYGVLGNDDYGQQVIGDSSAFTATGVPTQYMRDYDPNGIRLIPIPTAADTLELQCTVTISGPIQVGGALPFAEVPEQRLMLLKMKQLAYGKHDADTFDPQRSAAFGQEFEAKVEERAVQLRNYRRKPGVVRMEW